MTLAQSANDEWTQEAVDGCADRDPTLPDRASDYCCYCWTHAAEIAWPSARSSRSPSPSLLAGNTWEQTTARASMRSAMTARCGRWCGRTPTMRASPRSRGGRRCRTCRSRVFLVLGDQGNLFVAAQVQARPSNDVARSRSRNGGGAAADGAAVGPCEYSADSRSSIRQHCRYLRRRAKAAKAKRKELEAACPKLTATPTP